MPSRFLIGIDLGTTNSVLAYIDTPKDAGSPPEIHVLPIPQLVAQGEVRTLPALPSFLYFPTQDELSTGAVSATWDEDPPMVTGLLAREQGALLPSRQVSSAKSWLSSAGVSRRAKILPSQAEPGQPTISPVDASTRYLMHLRDAWNGAFGHDVECRFDQQEIVLTVPASFDEEARELTVEAARAAGIVHLTLLEEPIAAFYSWMETHEDQIPGGLSGQNRQQLRDGDLILICDIGGGTTDFSLVRAYNMNGEMRFERTAIGEHLLLGGDNLDLALARHVEQKFAGSKLTLRQRYALRIVCSGAKERLLSADPLESLPITLLGSGSAVVGQALSVDLTREEVLKILLEGFLPITTSKDTPIQSRSIGLRELALPYASDPAITKHLAAFLFQSAVTMNISSQPAMVRPDAVLFNGGFCVPDLIRRRIVRALSEWFGESDSNWNLKVLNNTQAESAVTRGAAYYGLVRRGLAQRIRVGSARSYYVGLESTNGLIGICILPAGVEAGTTLPPLSREFSVLANRPVSFSLYSSLTQHAAHGEVVSLDTQSTHHHAPLVSVLRYGKKLREVQLSVHLRASLTEVGTLELWCESRDTTHRWRLQFELRGEDSDTQRDSVHVRPITAPSEESDITFQSAANLIRNVFGRSSDGDPVSLVSELETVLGNKRDSWQSGTLRTLGDVLIEESDGRTKSPHHELRWFNLAGFCLRPGFGIAGDNSRIDKLQTIITSSPEFRSNLQCHIERLAFLRRAAGGLSASTQQALYRQLTTEPDRKKSARRNRQVDYEHWRLLASLEHLPARTRAALGKEVLAKAIRDPADPIWLWALGRLGSRIPLYGSLNCVVTPSIATDWVNTLIGLSFPTKAFTATVISIARMCDDSSRDIDGDTREQAVSCLRAVGISEQELRPLLKYSPPDWTDAAFSFGEPLPADLQLVSSASCLLSLPAFRGSTPSAAKPA